MSDICPKCDEPLVRGRCTYCGKTGAAGQQGGSRHSRQCRHYIGPRRCQMSATIYPEATKIGRCEWHTVYASDPRMAQDPTVFTEYWNHLALDYPQHPWLDLDRQEAWDRLMGHPAFDGRKGYASLTVLPSAGGASSTGPPSGKKAAAGEKPYGGLDRVGGSLPGVLDSLDDRGVEIDEGQD